MTSKRWYGSITIYVALIFTIIIALVLVMAESARISGIKAMMLPKLVIASNSVLADYDRDIYNNYKVFMYDGKNKDEILLVDKIETSIEGYLANYSGDYGFNRGQVDKVKLKGIDRATVNLQERFTDQVVEYMKYKVPANISVDFLEMLNVLDGSGKTMEVIKCKAAVESKIFDCQDMILELVQQVDGIYCEYNAYGRTKKGDLIPNEAFAKRVVAYMENKESVGINNDFVYSCMKEAYYDVGREIDSLLEKLEWLSDNFEKYNDQSDKVFDECQEIIYSIEEESKKCYESIETSLAFISEIKEEAKEIELELKVFSESIDANKSELNKDIYEELTKENEELLKQPMNNLDNIEERLKQNKDIILNLNGISGCGYNYSQSGIEKAYKSVQDIKKELKDYRVDDICFDYSKVKREIPETKDSSMDGLKTIIEEGIARICISNYNQLSKGRLNDTGLVSQVCDTDTGSSLSSKIEKIITSPKEIMSGMVDKLMKALEDEIDVGKFLSKTKDEITEELLVSEYIGEYFTSMTNTKASSELTHTLAYEQEYIVIGDRSDRINVKGIIKRLLGIRVVINLICILGDGECRAQAHAMATSLTAYFGNVAVTYFVSTIIQIIWAYEEAVVDVCAITQGKYVPLIKTAPNLKVQAATIFIFGKPTINNLANGYSDTDSPTDFGYDEYMKLFIILLDDEVTAARTMDLIQSNINRNYNKNINFYRLLTGWEVEVSIDVSNIFTSIPFVTAYDKEKKQGGNKLKFSYKCSY